MQFESPIVRRKSRQIMVGNVPVGGDAPKRLIWQAVPLTGETLYEAGLKSPSDRKFFWDIATIAVKYDGAGMQPMDQWLNAGDGPFDGWSGKKLGESSGDETRKALAVIDLTGKIDTQGKLAWKVPKTPKKRASS